MILMTAAQQAMMQGGSTSIDPHWSNVVSLLRFNDPGDPFKDEKGILWTGSGSPVLDTINKKFGASSLGLDGSSHLSASNSGFAFGTGDYTIEAWVRDGGNKNKGIFTNRMTNTHTGTTGLAIESANRLFVQNNAKANLSATQARTGFFHAAMSRVSGQLRAFVNGIVVFGPISEPTNFILTNFYIGGYYSTAYRMLGNIDELRITAGVSRYNAAFTPPSDPFPGA